MNKTQMEKKTKGPLCVTLQKINAKFNFLSRSLPTYTHPYNLSCTFTHTQLLSFLPGLICISQKNEIANVHDERVERTL